MFWRFKSGKGEKYKLKAGTRTERVWQAGFRRRWRGDWEISTIQVKKEKVKDKEDHPAKSVYLSSFSNTFLMRRIA